MLRLIFLSGALFVSLLHARSANDLPIFSVLKQADRSLADMAVLHRTSVTGALDLVIAIGSPKGQGELNGPVVWWGEKRKLGLFLQEQAQPYRVYSLAIEPGFPDCAARIARATETDTVIECTGEKSDRFPSQKFVYDVRARSLVRHLSYQPFSMYRIFGKPAGAVIIGGDTSRLIAVDFQPGRDPEFRVLNDVEGQSWIRRVAAQEGTAGLDNRRFVYVQPEKFKPFQFGEAGAFKLIQEPGNSLGPQFVVMHTQGKRTVRHALPLSTYKEFAEARTGRVKNGYTPGVEFDDRIGPRTLEQGKLWFGKTFYDGEGITGIGGFGYFDTSDTKYHLFTPPEIVDWSVSAIHVEKDSVWLALVNHGEWGGSSGGLLVFDRQSNHVRKLEIPDIGVQFMRVGEHLLLAGNSGITVLHGDQISRYLVDRTTDGRLRVVPASGTK
jgi:hypothetical protein